MAREIEMKIPLTENEFMKLSREFLNSKNEIILKSDEYFSRFHTKKERVENNEPQVIRVRTEKYIKNNNNMFKKVDSFQEIADFFEHAYSNSSCPFEEKSFFTLKTKNVKDGIELNEEHESFIQNAAALIKLFKSTGFIKWFEKTKYSISAFFPFQISDEKEIELHAELEIVNRLPYIEIEYTKDDLDAETVKKSLEKKIVEFGLDPSKRDERSWKEILMPDKSEKSE